MNCRTHLENHCAVSPSAAPQLVKALGTPVIFIKRLQYLFGNSGPQEAHFHVAITVIPSCCSAKYTLFLPVNPTAFLPSCSSTDRCCYRHTAPLNPQRAYTAEHVTKYHYVTIHQAWQPATSGNSSSKNFTFSSKSQLKISNIRLRKT